MLGKGRKLAIIIATVLCVGAFAAACAGTNDEDKKYSVTYEAGYAGATETVPAETYAEGETVTLRAANTFTRGGGYLFVNWSDGSATYNAGATYTMPAHDVVFTAQWREEQKLPEGAEKITAFPAGTLTLVNGDAKAHYTAEYAAEGLVITAWVEDSYVSTGNGVSGNDGVSVIFAKQERVSGYSQKAHRVRVDLDGNLQAATLYNTQRAEVEGLTAETKYLTLDEETVAGYRIKITMPYTAIGVTQANHDAVIALGFQNEEQLLYDNTFDTDITQVHTYMLVQEDGTFAANPDLELGKVWGNGGSGLAMVGSWNILTDDGSADSYIEMNEAFGGTDNNIYMHHSNTAKNFYAETELTVKYADDTLEGHYDKYPKFGVAVYNADGSKGVLFYVDAVSDANPPAINSNSTNLGYNIRSNGNWGSWNNVGKTVGANASVYQCVTPEEGGDTVENYVKMGIYRQGAAFKLVYNGEAVHTLYGVGIGPEEDAYFCIISFNLVLKAKNYSYKTDEATLQKYYEDLSVKEDVDYLFMGDSYMDTAFFQTFADSFGKLSAVDLGVGGTKVEYWQDQSEALLPHYNPKKVIIHIGVNNLDDAGQSDQKVIGLLGDLFDSLHALWPEAEIYYISIVDNVMFHQYAEKYEAVNAWVEEQEDIHFIDMRPYVTKTEGAADLMWFYDGLHYSPAGYALLVRTIAEAVGANVGETEVVDGLGNLMKGESLYLTHSANFKVEGEGDEQIWHAKQETPFTETLLPIAGAYGANVYAEAKISVKQYLGGDNWAKAGLAISSKKGTYFYFIDLNSTNNPNNVFTNHWAALVWRPEIYGQKVWQWNEIQPHFNNSENGYSNLGNDVKFDYNVDQGFITLGVSKVGSKLYFTADGHVVGLPVASQFEENEEVSIFVLDFNMEMYVKGGYATTTLSEIYQKTPAAHGTTKTLDGDLADWTEEQKTNPFRVPLTDGRSFTVYAYMDTYGVNIFYEVVHNTHIQKGRLDGGNYSHWWESTNVEFRLGGDTFGTWSGLGEGPQWLVSVNGQRNTDEAFIKTEEIEGGKYRTVAEIFVSYVNIAGYDYSKDYVPAAFGFKVVGETSSGTGLTDCSSVGLWFTGDGYDWGWRGAEVTKNGIRTGTLQTIDGDLSDWTDDQFKDAGKTEVLAEAKYAAYLGTDGLYLAVKVKGANGKAIKVDQMNTAAAWWQNTNLEFFSREQADGAKPVIGHYAGKVMTFGGKLYHTGWISDAEMKVLEDGTVCFEIFISNRWLRTPQAESIYMDFGGQMYVEETEGNTFNAFAHDEGAVTVTRKQA